VGFFRILGLVLELPNCLKEPVRSLVRLPPLAIKHMLNIYLANDESSMLLGPASLQFLDA
jgi:hypothetical protein